MCVWFPYRMIRKEDRAQRLRAIVSGICERREEREEREDGVCRFGAKTGAVSQPCPSPRKYTVDCFGCGAMVSTQPSGTIMKLSQYFEGIARSASSIFEGLAVTFSHLLREPVTIQYPDRTTRPVSEMLPHRYRGLLELQKDICGGCRRCERICPIDCIRVETRKSPETNKLMLVRFDIDMSKCMYCGMCAEACGEGATGALRHTREFEGSTGSVDALVFRFVAPGTESPMYRVPKDKSEIPVGKIGPYAREARERALRDNVPLLGRIRDQVKSSD